MKASLLMNRSVEIQVVGAPHTNLQLMQVLNEIAATITLPNGKKIKFYIPPAVKKYRLVDDRKGIHKDWLLVMASSNPPRGSDAIRAWNTKTENNELSVGTAYLEM